MQCHRSNRGKWHEGPSCLDIEVGMHQAGDSGSIQCHYRSEEAKRIDLSIMCRKWFIRRHLLFVSLENDPRMLSYASTEQSLLRTGVKGPVFVEYMQA